MINQQQIANGVMAYLNDEVISKIDGLMRWAYGAAVRLLLPANIDRYIELFRQNPLALQTGAIDSDGNIDLDKLYSAIRPEAEKGPVQVVLPGLPTPLVLDVRDVDALYRRLQTA